MIGHRISSLRHLMCLIKMMLQLAESAATCLKMAIMGKGLISSFEDNYDFVNARGNGIICCRLDILVSGDQIRKGAALNAVQIAEMLL